MSTPEVTPGVTPPRLVLPRRFEKLEQFANEAGTPIQNLVRKLVVPTRHIEALLRSVRDQGIGRFEFLLGLSGSGKTTFLRTLPNFFSGAPVVAVPKDLPITDVPKWLTSQRTGSTEPSIYVLYDRDNPKDDLGTIRTFFDDLRILFREAHGGLILIWPITDQTKAAEYANAAWEVGRDSIVNEATKGVYAFLGLDRSEYYDTASTTTMSLNGGRPLEAFGLTRTEAEPLVRDSQTISAFYARLEDRSISINNTYGDLLKERVVPRVWVLLAGDDAKSIYTTLSTLTQGLRGEVDVARLVGYLDDPKLDAGYLQQWKKLRDRAVYLLTLFDVRLFGLYPNVCVGAVRSFGSEGTKKLLTTLTGVKDASMEALSATPVYRAMLDPAASVTTAPRETEEKTAAEYLRLQASAAKDDTSLNKAIAECLQATFAKQGLDASVASEQQSLPDSKLQPDVQVALRGARLVCLETTWRTTGRAVEGVRGEGQNSLTTGHIQQYLLQKVLSYVEDFKLS